VVPVGCLTPVLLCGGGIVSIFVLVFSSLKSTDVYKEALSRATDNAEVKKLLGEPITPSFWVAGTISTNITPNGSVGKAEILIPISGPKGSAIVQAVASKANDKWDFSKLEVKAEGAAFPIDLLPKVDKPETTDKPKALP
jgi:hypothetical protein